MKYSRVLFIMIVIAAIVIGGISQHLCLNSVSSEILPLAEQLSLNIRLGDLQKAESTFRDLQFCWRAKVNRLSCITEQSFITDIDITLSEIVADLYSENAQQLPAEAARLSEQIHALIQTGRFTFSNIF